MDAGAGDAAVEALAADQLHAFLLRPSEQLAALSAWVDAANQHRDAEAQTWGRIGKIAEEHGEVVAAYIAALGANPRKAATGDLRAVGDELLDVAVTALAAFEHLTGNQGVALVSLADHVDRLATRAGVQP